MHLPTLHLHATIQVPDDAVKNDQEIPAEKTVPALDQKAKKQHLFKRTARSVKHIVGMRRASV